MFMLTPATDGKTWANPLESQSIRYANIEITTRCNNRCVYCPVSQPGHCNADMPLWTVHDIHRALQKRRAQFVVISGTGETTVVHDWLAVCHDFVGGDSQVGIVSNFAKRFSPDELRFLACFSEVTVSLDTADAEMLAKIRRGARLATVVANIKGVKAAAAELGTQGPRLVLSCGVYNKNVLGLEQLALLAIELSIDHVSFWNLYKLPDIEAAENIDLLTSMPRDELRAALAAIDTTTIRLRAHAISFCFLGEFVDIIRKQLESDETS